MQNVHLVHIRDIAAHFQHVLAVNGVYEDGYKIAGVWKGPDESIVERLDLDDVRVDCPQWRRVHGDRARHRKQGKKNGLHRGE